MSWNTDRPVSFKKKKQNTKDVLLETKQILNGIPHAPRFHDGDGVTVLQQKSHKESLNSHLDRLNLWFELRSLFYGD